MYYIQYTIGFKYWHPCYHNSVMMVSMTFGFTSLAMIASLIVIYGKFLKMK